MMKNSIFIFLLLLSMHSLHAINFTVNGIRYNTTGTSTVEVTSGGAYTGSITIPSSVIYSATTYTVTSIGESSFRGSSLTSVSIPESVTSIGERAFQDCGSLTSVTIPASVTSIGESTFINCGSLTQVTLPSSLTSIADGVFGSCESLSSISIPSSVTSIGGMAFIWCVNLKSVNIPSSVTFIGYCAFYDCGKLTTINIPASVTFIDSQAFEGCSSLSSIYAYPSIPVSLIGKSYVFDGVNNTTCTLYVPIGSKDKYKVADQWKDFRNIEEFNASAVATTNTVRPDITYNPAANSLQIKGIEGNASISLYNLNGRLLLSRLIPDSGSVSTPALSQGVYIVKAYTGTGVITRKVVVQ